MPKFELGEAVWAKLGGDPYWPALVWPFDRVGADVKRHREPGTTLVRFFDGGENPFGFPLEIHVKPWKGVHFAEHASIRRVKRATEECQFHVENGRTMDDIQVRARQHGGANHARTHARACFIIWVLVWVDVSVATGAGPAAACAQRAFAGLKDPLPPSSATGRPR